MRLKFQFIWIRILIILILVHTSAGTSAQTITKDEVLKTIFKATKFMDEKVSVNGGYVWYYKQDLSRRWGEMEAFPTMVWIQGPGIVSMGNLFLEIYRATNDEYYYKLACKSVDALIKGQLKCGGWNYMVDFAGEASLKKWYSTIGQNGWRLEEFREYLGNATFDDEVTEGAASLLLKMYLTKKEKKYKAPLDKAINFVLASQYKAGGWPQRFPKANISYKNSPFAYSNDYTFNDGVTANNLKFLLKCYYVFNDKKFIAPVKRAMDFFLITQGKNPQAGWSQQYTLDLKPDGARTYEAKSLDPIYTANHLELLMKFYEMSGDKKYITRIQDGIDWIKSIMLSKVGDDGLVTVPKFVEYETNRPLYLHRTGENRIFGKYFFNYDSKNTVVHYKSTRELLFRLLEKEFETIKQKNISKNLNLPFNISVADTVKDPMQKLQAVDEFFSSQPEKESRFKFDNEQLIKKIISDLDSEGRWLTKNAFISNPFIGEPETGDSTTVKYETTRVGNKYDTSPYENSTDEKYISTGDFIRNVSLLLRFLEKKEGM